MIVRRLAEARDTARHVNAEHWESTRLLLASDGMGFSFHITTIHAGTRTPMHYRHHLESVYCVAGTGWIQELASERVHRLEPGTIYALDQHDHHVLEAETEMHMACVFSPALHGREVHDESGAYPQAAEPVTEG